MEAQEMKVTPHVAFNCCTELIQGAEPQLIIQRREPIGAFPLIFAINLTSFVTVSWCSGPCGRQVNFHSKSPAFAVGVGPSDALPWEAALPPLPSSFETLPVPLTAETQGAELMSKLKQTLTMASIPLINFHALWLADLSWERRRMSNNMAKIADARKTVEQLKLEVNIERMMISKAAADLMAYCEGHAKEDPLVTPVPSSENPFRDKKLFCVIL